MKKAMGILLDNQQLLWYYLLHKKAVVGGQLTVSQWYKQVQFATEPKSLERKNSTLKIEAKGAVTDECEHVPWL